MVMRQAEVKRYIEGLVQANQDRAREARVAVRDEHVRQVERGNHTSRNTEDTKFRAAVSAAAGLNVRTSHTLPVRRLMCTCKKSWPELVTGSSMKSRRMQPPRLVGTRRGQSRQAGGTWLALTRWQSNGR